MSMTAFKF